MISSTEIEIPGIMIVYEPKLNNEDSGSSPQRREIKIDPEEEDQIVIIFSNN